VRHAGRLVTKDELVRHVWDGRVVADNAITVSISRLRKLLGDRAGRERVVSVYGRGYRFIGEVSFESDRHASDAPGLVNALPLTLVEPPSEEGRAPFVGRDRAMSRLRRALSEARRGRGQACMLLGEPGIGKTRVVEALERDVSCNGVRIAWGYCREAGDTPPLWPFLRILRTVTETVTPSYLEQRLGSLAQDVHNLLAGSRTGSDSSLDPMRAEHLGFRGAARHRGLDAILRTLAVAAEQMPWVIVLEDLHRADAASLELLGLMLDELAHMRILVVATLRPKSAGRSQRSERYLSEVVGHRNCERIVLERLTQEDVSHYVRAMM
jgi:predicted ATPase